MKIDLEGTLIKMTPENDCVNQNKKLVPVGEYIPGMKEVATFNIE
jgi:hypothetical protein